MRNAFARALVEAGLADERVVLLTGDHGYALFDDFRRVCPKQYVNAGVAEQNMVGVAAGLAKAGFRPVVYGLSAFIPIRVLEQIKLDICYENLPVVLIGDGAGVVYGTLGASHQSTEDIACLRALPHVSILSPADAFEMASCMELALRSSGPVYLRIGKADLGPVHRRAPEVRWGQLVPVARGPGPMAWVATGSMVQTAITASANWPGSTVWSAPSLKPLSQNAVSALCRRFRVIVTLEEHSVFGGLGSAISEIAAACGLARVCAIGIRDRFSARCGSYSYLMNEHGLAPDQVQEQVERFLARMHKTRAKTGRRAPVTP
jgi:transketolase